MTRPPNPGGGLLSMEGSMSWQGTAQLIKASKPGLEIEPLLEKTNVKQPVGFEAKITPGEFVPEKLPIKAPEVSSPS